MDGTYNVPAPPEDGVPYQGGYTEGEPVKNAEVQAPSYLVAEGNCVACYRV